MEIAVQSVASSLNIAGVGKHKDENGVKTGTTLTKKASQPKYDIIFMKRVFLTAVTYMCYNAMGFNSGVIGPTMANLIFIFETDVASFSKCFISTGFGFLIGAIINGVMFDRFNYYIQFTLWCTLLSMSVAILPWLPDLNYFYIISFTEYLAQGSLLAGGQSFILYMWANSSYRGALLIGTHLMWSIGCLIVPFIAMPFLVPMQENDTFVSNDTTALEIKQYNFSVVESSSFSGIYKVRYAYIIIGILNMLPAILFFIVFLVSGPSCLKKQVDVIPDSVVVEYDTSKDNDMNKKCTFKLFTVTMLIILGAIALFMFWHEYVLGNFLAIFVTIGLDWNSQQAAMLVSIFFGFHGLGRTLGIGISKFLTPTKVLIINMLFTVIGTSLFFLVHISDIFVFIGTAVSGLAISTTFPTLILWTSKYIPVTGVTASIFIAAGSIGGLTGGTLVGYLFQRYSYMWMVYISCGSAVFCAILFSIVSFIGYLFNEYKNNYDRENCDVEDKGKSLLSDNKVL